MTRRLSSREPPRSSLYRVTGVLYRSLEASLTAECNRRYDAGLVPRLYRVSENGTKVRLLILCRDLARMPAGFRVRPVGGNVYDILCTVETGRTRRFTYSLPDDGDTALIRSPTLGEPVATFLLKELETRLGRELLKRAARPPRRAPSPSRQGKGLSEKRR